MSFLIKRMLSQQGYMEENKGDDGSGGGGGDADAAAKAAAVKVASDAAAAVAAAKALADAELLKSAKVGPTDEEAKLLKEVMDKKTKLKEASDKIATLEAAVKRFDGIDPDAVMAMLNEKKNEEIKKLEANGEWDRLKAQMNDEHGKQLTSVKTEADAAKADAARLSGVIAELTVGNAFASSAFIKEDLTMPSNKVRVVYGAHFEFKDGSVVAFDKPTGSAERTVLVDAKGDPLSFELALKKIVDADPDREQMLKSKMKPGSGSKTGTKVDTPNQTFDEPRGVTRISAALSKGDLKK